MCEDDLLAFVINVSTLYEKMISLIWDCIDISEKAIVNNSASLWINKEE